MTRLERPRTLFVRPLIWGVMACLAGACAEPAGGDRQAFVVTTLTRADEALLRTRPALVAGKYARMARDPYAFFRGSMALFSADW